MPDASAPSTVGLILSSGLLAAVLTQGAGALLARRGAKKAADYLALRLALVVEAFGEDCVQLAQEHDIYIGSRGEAGGRTHHLPKIGKFPPDDGAWRELPADLSARVLGMSPLLRATQRQIAFTWTEGEPEDAMKECRDEAVLLGCQAALLARDLRQRMKLPQMQSQWDWSGELEDMRLEIYRKRALGSPM